MSGTKRKNAFTLKYLFKTQVRASDTATAPTSHDSERIDGHRHSSQFTTFLPALSVYLARCGLPFCVLRILLQNGFINTYSDSRPAAPRVPTAIIIPVSLASGVNLPIPRICESDTGSVCGRGDGG